MLRLSILACFLSLAACAQTPPPPSCYSRFCTMEAAELAAVNENALTADEKVQLAQARAFSKQRVKYEKEQRRNAKFYYGKVELTHTGGGGAFEASSERPYEVSPPTYGPQDSGSEYYYLHSRGDAHGIHHWISVKFERVIQALIGYGPLRPNEFWRDYNRAYVAGGAGLSMGGHFRNVFDCGDRVAYTTFTSELAPVHQCSIVEAFTIDIPDALLVRVVETGEPLVVYATSRKGVRNRFELPPTFVATYLKHIDDETGRYGALIAKMPAFVREQGPKR